MQLWISVARQTTHMHRHARTRTAREWLLGGFTWITQPAETHSVTLAFHTPPHTHTPKKKTSYSGNLWLCADIWDDCWAAFLDKMSHKWISCKHKQLYDCQAATFLFFFITHFCQVQATGDDSWYILLMSASESCCTDSLPWTLAMSFLFLLSFFLSHSLVLLPLQVASTFIFTFVGVLAVRLWFLTVHVREGGDGVLEDAIWGDFSCACGLKALCIWLSSCIHGHILYRYFHINYQLKDLKLTSHNLLHNMKSDCFWQYFVQSVNVTLIAGCNTHMLGGSWWGLWTVMTVAGNIICIQRLFCGLVVATGGFFLQLGV